jgi:fumarate hydratase subunit alpha
MQTIQKFILDCVLRAGSQPCPPIIIGIGIGGTFEHAAKLAKYALMRPVGHRNSNSTIAGMEQSLQAAVNQTGIGPMGLGGDTTALAVNIEYASGHGFVPVAVCFNCWPNRKASARIFGDNSVKYLE